LPLAPRTTTLSEEYDPVDQRLLGNFPQAFSHFSMVNTAFNLEGNTSASASGGSPRTKIK
jgi:GH15 family glucan-1,4-alpha-glucosidase